MTAALEVMGVTKRYREHWALRDCSFRLGQGRVAALLGQNGAGKSTLLHLAVGLATPTSGHIRIFGEAVHPGDVGFLPRIGFVAQDAPLYRSLTARDLLAAGRHLNVTFDDRVALDRWRELGIPIDVPVGTLSGGQRAQVALALALAKRPSLLLLDEPLASLDPLARREFLRTLMAAVAEFDTTVLLSSHLLAELERVCDHVLVLGRGRIQLAGDVDDIVAAHWWTTLRTGDLALDDGATVVERRSAQREDLLLVRRDGAPRGPATSKPTLEDIVLGYLAHPDVITLPGPERMEVAG